MAASSAQSEPENSTPVLPHSPPPTMLDNALIANLAEEMIQRWHHNDPVHAEELLNRHPEIWHKPELALEIVYEEICQRKDQGQKDYAAAVLRRFPQWRGRLEVMLECHRLLETPDAEPRFPRAGETLAGYRLLEQLGRGASGRVFLAQQSDLADRPVVLKLTSLRGQEHLNLARLQHTHIVPLYAVQDDAVHHLRILCMPYFGGVTLENLLHGLAGCPFDERSGSRLMQALEAWGVQPAGPAQLILSRLSYVQSLCWIGACLADALHYAQEVGLVHLDVKPSNILIGADGQPMLLDFHLARGPLEPGGPLPDGIGGTPPYMAPEQADALAALAQGQPLPAPVDQRADIFGLGAVLYEALGGKLPLTEWSAEGTLPTVTYEKARASQPPRSSTGARAPALPPLYKINPQVSRGLSDIVAKCLAWRPEGRYVDASELGIDLRCHLADQALQYAPNRSWRERLGKWRRRRPHSMQTMTLLLVVLGSLVALAIGAWSHWKHLDGDVLAALEEGRKRREQGRLADSMHKLKHGLELAWALPFQQERIVQLEEEIRLVEQAKAEQHRIQALGELHQLAEQVRGVFDLEQIPADRLAALNKSCREFWSKRREFQNWLAVPPSSEMAADLLDLVLFAADLQIRLAGPTGEKNAVARRQALKDLDEAEALFGTSAVLYQERERHRQALGLPAAKSPAPPPPRSVWEHVTLGRTALLAGDPHRASAYLQKALERQPHGFWPNFYQGQCAYQLENYAEAVAAFSVCIGAAPTVAGPYYNRALAYAGLDQSELALRDYDHVLELDPTMTRALLNRGLLHFQAKDYVAAEADLYRALHLGAPEAPVYFDLAQVQLASQNTPAALRSLDRVLSLAPDHPEARALRDRLRGNR